ncbi:hypothetical protein [Neptuniibacter sp. QD37_11]
MSSESKPSKGRVVKFEAKAERDKRKLKEAAAARAIARANKRSW